MMRKVYKENEQMLILFIHLINFMFSGKKVKIVMMWMVMI